MRCETHLQVPCLRFSLAGSLSRSLETERERESFEPLPFHYIEIAQLLFGAERYDKCQVISSCFLETCCLAADA